MSWRLVFLLLVCLGVAGCASGSYQAPQDAQSGPTYHEPGGGAGGM